MNSNAEDDEQQQTEVMRQDVLLLQKDEESSSSCSSKQGGKEEVKTAEDNEPVPQTGRAAEGVPSSSSSPTNMGKSKMVSSFGKDCTKLLETIRILKADGKMVTARLVSELANGYAEELERNELSPKESENLRKHVPFSESWLRGFIKRTGEEIHKL